MTIALGTHVDQSDPIAEAIARDISLVQIMVGDPQSWKKPEVTYPGGPEALGQAAADAGVEIVIHAAYLINVASPNNRIRIPSRRLLQSTLDLAHVIGAKGVVVHGGHVTADNDPMDGYANWLKAVDSLKPSCPIWIENTAGGKKAMCRYLDSIEQLWTHISRSDNIESVGFCLDTCHAFAAGLSMESVVDDIYSITGRIDLVHLNDSQGEAGSGRDRHANLGEGKIDPNDLVSIVQKASADVILETPGDAEMHRRDLEWIASRSEVIHKKATS